jgi:hypothetical protein
MTATASTRPQRETDLEHAPGGWGLMIVAQLTDRWRVDASHSTRVWCEFERSAAPGARGTA